MGYACVFELGVPFVQMSFSLHYFFFFPPLQEIQLTLSLRSFFWAPAAPGDFLPHKEYCITLW